MTDNSFTNGIPIIGIIGQLKAEPDTEQFALLDSVGTLITDNGFAAVFQGRNLLYEPLNTRVRNRGGRSVVISTEELDPNDLALCDRHIIVEQPLDGIRVLYQLCRAVVVLPGGIQTLQELSYLWALQVYEDHTRPIIVVGPHWKDFFVAFSKHMNLSAETLRATKTAVSLRDLERSLATIRSL